MACCVFAALMFVFDPAYSIASDLSLGLSSALLGVLGGGLLVGLISGTLRHPAERLMGSVSRDRLIELTDLEQPLLQRWREEQGLEVEAKQAWTDVARLTSHGIPAVNFGPGETAQAHQANESIPISYLERGYRALRGLFR